MTAKMYSEIEKEEHAVKSDDNSTTSEVITSSVSTWSILLQDSDSDTSKFLNSCLIENDNNNIDDATVKESRLPVTPECNFERQHQLLQQQSVETVLREAIKSIDAYVKQQRQQQRCSRERTVRLKTKSVERNLDVDTATGNWLGCLANERKKYERLSLRSWRFYNRLLYHTQISLKYFNIKRKIYKKPQ